MLENLPSVPGLPWPGFGPAPEPVQGWAVYDDGSLGVITVGGCERPELSQPGRLITKAEFDRLSVEMATAHTVRLQEMEDAETARQAQEFRDLTQAGIPEKTARRLAGYTDGSDSTLES